MACILGIRGGRADARAGRPPYLDGLLLHPEHRSEYLRTGLTAIRDIVAIGIVLDAVAQLLISRQIHPGAALGVKHVLQPGLAGFTRSVSDRSEIAGWKLVKRRESVLQLWLQLWDAQAGQILWESAGEVAVASEIIRERMVPLNEMARKLWARMIQDALLGGRTQSQYFEEERMIGDETNPPQAERKTE